MSDCCSTTIMSISLALFESFISDEVGESTKIGQSLVPGAFTFLKWSTCSFNAQYTRISSIMHTVPRNPVSIWDIKR